MRPERSPTVFELHCYVTCLLPVAVHCHISPVRVSPTIRTKCKRHPASLNAVAGVPCLCSPAPGASYAAIATAGAGDTAEQAGGQLLREGCRIELTGLGSEGLNGQRGGIRGSFLAHRGRWPVVMDGTGRELSCKPTNLKELASCGHCGAEKRLDALRKCGRCLAVHYCDGACQRLHWKRGGHKQACKESLACIICLDNEGHPLPIQCGCGCRDEAGCAHVACKATYAAHQGPGYHTGWTVCPTCKQKYTGAMKLGLAETLCARLHGRPAEDNDRLCARNLLAIAYLEASRLAEAETLFRDLLATRRRVDGPNHVNTLRVAGNLGGVLTRQGKNSDAEAVYRDTLERQREALGPEHGNTLATASNLAGALQNQRKVAEAEPLVHDTLAIQQRVLGEEHHDTLRTANSLTRLLINTGKNAAAEELGRGTLAQAQRTLGPDHPRSLEIAYTLATALGNQGQTAEAVDLLTVTLATQQRVLGPGHPNTQRTAQELQYWQQHG